ncbi:MAG: LbtU family siderophore porin [Sinimarinibacterium sp.]|jgi:hypothetical protein
MRPSRLRRSHPQWALGLLHGLALVVLSWPGFVQGQEEAAAATDDERARIYTTREERRDAGLKHALADWLLASGLVEFETLDQRRSLFDESGHSDDSEYTATLQLGVEATPLEWMKIELISELEQDSETGQTGPVLDEAVLALEAGDFELELGKLYVPFGVYFSRFVSGPLVEFGETRAHAAALSYGPDERLDIVAFTYDGRARPLSGSRRRDWGFALEVSPLPFATVGASYLSDLADSDEDLLDDSQGRYEQRVDAWSAYAVAGAGPFEASVEWLAARRAFRELDTDRNRPRAWNIELAYAPRDDVDCALRYEGSRELEDAPRWQAGVAATWRALRSASLTVEYLRARFRRGLAEDARERPIDGRDLFAAQLSVEF